MIVVGARDHELAVRDVAPPGTQIPVVAERATLAHVDAERDHRLHGAHDRDPEAVVVHRDVVTARRDRNREHALALAAHASRGARDATDGQVHAVRDFGATDEEQLATGSDHDALRATQQRTLSSWQTTR